MEMNIDPQRAMNGAYDTFNALAGELKAEIEYLLDRDDDSEFWKRIFVRSGFALIEGYCHCIRELTAVRFQCSIAPSISKKQNQVLLCEKSFDADDRIKHTLNAACNTFGLIKIDFGSNEWELLKQASKKRNALMHPKSSNDFSIGPEWNAIYNGIVWMFEQLFTFCENLHDKHSSGTKSSTQ